MQCKCVCICLCRMEGIINGKAERGLRTLGMSARYTQDDTHKHSRPRRQQSSIWVCFAGVCWTDPETIDWQFVGLISLFDPPVSTQREREMTRSLSDVCDVIWVQRDDTKHTIEQSMEYGVDVKMVTGDQRAIAIETARRLGMGTNIIGNEVSQLLISRPCLICDTRWTCCLETRADMEHGVVAGGAVGRAR